MLEIADDPKIHHRLKRLPDKIPPAIPMGQERWKVEANRSRTLATRFLLLIGPAPDGFEDTILAG